MVLLVYEQKHQLKKENTYFILIEIKYYLIKVTQPTNITG